MTATVDAPTHTTAELQHRLERELEGGAADVRFDDYTRHLFSRDASMYTIMPLGVAFPRHADDVAAAVRACARPRRPGARRVAPAPAWPARPSARAWCWTCPGTCTEIVALDPDARTARVQPGVVQDELNRAAAPHGLMFGPDTSTSNRATIGGMVGNNSAGSGSVRYGMTIDHVRALDVVLSDGSPATRFEPVDADERARRRAGPTPSRARSTAAARAGRGPTGTRSRPASPRTGGAPAATGSTGCSPTSARAPFDLAKFVVGAEGTLVVVTEAEVDLVPKPPHTVFGVGHFDSVQEAIDATADALALDPAQVELLDRTILDLSRQKIEYAGLGEILEGDPEALLFVSFTGDDRGRARPTGSTGSRRCGRARARLPHCCARRPPSSRATCSRCARPASDC